MKYRTRHILIATALCAVVLAFLIPFSRPFIVRGRQSIFQQLCQDLQIKDAKNTRRVAFSKFEAPSGVYHTYVLIYSNVEGEHVLRHAFHEPRNPWWETNWYALNTETLHNLGYQGLSLLESQSFPDKPSQQEMDAIVAHAMPILRSNGVTYEK